MFPRPVSGFRRTSTKHTTGHSPAYLSYSSPTAGPVISGVTSYNLTTSGATITWNLDQPGTGYVEYGLTTGYGSETTHENSYNYSTHIQSITGLASNTTYHYRVRSSAPQSNPFERISDDYTFTTAASGGGGGGSTFDTGMTYTTYTVPTGAGYTDGTNCKSNVEAWIAANVPDGTDTTHHSRISFPAGYTYTFTGYGLEITNRNHITLEGNGTEGTYGSTGGAKLKVTTAPASVPHDLYSCLNIRPTSFGATSAGSDIRIHGFTFEGSSTVYATTSAGDPEANEYQHGVALFGVNGCLIDHCTFDKLFGDGAYITDSYWGSGSNGYASRSVTMTYNDIKNNGRMGVAIIWAQDVTIQYNRFTDMAYAAFDIEPNHTWEGAFGTVTFSDNLLAGNWSWDATYGDGAINISGNDANHNTYSATFYIERNSLTGSSRDGGRFFILGDYGRWIKSGNVYIRNNVCSNPRPGPAVTLSYFTGVVTVTGNTGFLSSGSWVSDSGTNGTITQSGNS